MARRGARTPSPSSRTWSTGSPAVSRIADSARGTHSASWRRTSPSTPSSSTAVAVAGGTITTINPTYGAEEVRFQLQDAGASLLITIGMFGETALSAIEGTDVTEVLSLDGGDGLGDAMALMGDPIEQVAVDPMTDVVVLPYSSGTTGLPKGVMLTHHNLVANIAQCEPCIQFDDEGEVALAVPAVLPHLRHAGPDERVAGERRDGDHDAAIRPRAGA